MRRSAWRKRRRKGRDIIRLRPDPVFPDVVTYDRFEQVCLALGIDPDAAFRGEVSLHALPVPAVSKAERLLGLILENAEAYDVAAMPLDRRQAVLALVVQEFFFISGARTKPSRLMPTI